MTDICIDGDLDRITRVTGFLMCGFRYTDPRGTHHFAPTPNHLADVVLARIRHTLPHAAPMHEAMDLLLTREGIDPSRWVPLEIAPLQQRPGSPVSVTDTLSGSGAEIASLSGSGAEIAPLLEARALGPAEPLPRT